VTPTAARPSLSVIIPHYDQAQALDACLASLEAQSIAPERFEIVVVDNASPGGVDPVRAVVRNRARLYVETTKGAGPARNRGAAQARGESLPSSTPIASPRPSGSKRAFAASNASTSSAGGSMSRWPRRLA